MLPANAQRVLKLIHVLSAGIWLGALVAIVALLALGSSGVRARSSFGADWAVYRIHEVVLFFAFIGTLVTGVLFSLFTKWGFFKHHWITAKWVLALTLFTLTLWAQSPAVSGMVALSDAGIPEIHGYSYADYRASCFRFALVQLTIVVAVFAISVIKPWGKWTRQFRIDRRLVLGGFAIASAVMLVLSIVGYRNLEHYRTLPLGQINASALPDGHYRGEADCGFVYAVEAQVRSGRVSAVRVLQNRDAHYARIAEAVLSRVVSSQTLQVDTITGATTTSRCLLRATQAALSGAHVRQP